MDEEKYRQARHAMLTKIRELKEEVQQLRAENEKVREELEELLIENTELKQTRRTLREMEWKKTISTIKQT